MEKPTKNPRQKYTIAWIVIGCAFLGVEGIALLDPLHGDTLSEHVWTFLEGGWSRYLLIGGLMTWLTVHFLGKGKWG